MAGSGGQNIDPEKNRHPRSRIGANTMIRLEKAANGRLFCRPSGVRFFWETNMTQDHIAATSFLSKADLKQLVTGLNRVIPLRDDDLFANLIKKLDEIEIVPRA